MTRRAVPLALAAATAATALTAAPAAGATSVGSAVLVSDQTQGIVTVTQRDNRRRVKLSASLHGLKRKTGYRVVGGTRRCSSANLGRRIFELRLNVEAVQDVFVTELVRRTGSLGDVRCVRVVQEQTDGDFLRGVFVGGFGGGVDDDR